MAIQVKERSKAIMGKKHIKPLEPSSNLIKPDIHIPIGQLLEDKELKPWIDNIIGVLVDYDDTSINTNEQPIGICIVDYEVEKYGKIQIDIGVQLLKRTDTTIYVRLGTRVLGIDNKQEEVYMEVSKEELDILSISPLDTSLNLIPLAQEVYDRTLSFKEHSIFEEHRLRQKQ